MLKFKFKFILIFLILFLLCGSVWAAEENETVINTVDSNSTMDSESVSVDESYSDDLILSADSEDIVSADDPFLYRNIQNEILNTNKSVITLQKGTYRFGEGDSGLGMFVNRPVTIDGNGSTFDCSDQIFLIKADNVVLKNIIFTYNGKLTLSPNIIQWVGSNAVVDNCVFKNLIFDSPHGGAINWRGSNLTIVNSKFDTVGIEKGTGDASSWYTGKMKETSSGGAISIAALEGFNTLGNIIIVNTTFNKCKAGKSAGAIYMESLSHYADYVLLNNTKFTNCISGENAILSLASKGNLTILNSDFNKNYQFSHEGASDSSNSMIVLSSNNILINNCNFNENKDYSGAGLLNLLGGYLSNNAATKVNNVISNCNFKDNNEESDVYEFLSSTIYLMSGPLVKNSEELIGTLENKHQPEIINCLFEKNYQTLSPEFDLTKRPFMVSANNTHNSVFRYNIASGGAILIPYNGVYNCTFDTNEANFSVIDDHISDDGFEVINSTFDDNAGHNTGTLHNPNRVINCSFTLNEVDLNGGAIYLGKDLNANLKVFETYVDNCSFDRNKALNGSGGAIFSEFPKMLYINNSLFIDNFADHDGEETTKGCGGALYVDSVTINNSNFTHNQAKNGVGGAIFVDKVLYVDNSTFYRNVAEGKQKLTSWDRGYGGAILSYAGSFLINNSAFHYNQGLENGAAICCMELNLFNSNFTDNDGPSAVFFVDNKPTIMNCTFLYACSDPNYDNETRHLYLDNLKDMSVVNVINNTFDVWDSDLKANQTNNISSWVLISGFFNPGFNLVIPDLYLENESGLLFSVPVKSNQQIGEGKLDVYNLTGLIPGKYIAHHYYKDMRGNIYIPKNNLTNITFYIGRYIASINGTYNTTNTTVYFILEPNEYNNTKWKVFNSTGDIVLSGNNDTFIKITNGYCLDFTNLDAGNYTIVLNVTHEDTYFNLTCNFTVSKAKSSVVVNNKNIAKSIYNTTNVIINVTVCNQTSLKILINSTTNSSLYNIIVNINDGNATFDIVKGNDSYPDIVINSTLNQMNNTNNYLFSIFGLDVDKYIIHFNNTESGNYNSSYCNKTFEVSRANSLINVTNITDGIYDTCDVLINIGVLNQTDFSFMIYNSTGNITLNAILLGENLKLSIVNKTGNFNDTIIIGNVIKHFNLTYYYKFAVSALNAGNYNILFLNNQSRNYNEYKFRTSFKVNKATSKVNITNITDSLYNTTKTIVNVSVFNQTKFSFTISNVTTQIIVNVEVNGSDINLTINNKEKINVTITSMLVSHKDLDYNYTFEIIGLNTGKYNITMSNDENTNYNSTYDNSSFAVLKVNSSVIIKNVVNATYNTTDVVITYTIFNETKISYLIVNNATGANFTVIIDKTIKLVNVTKGLDIGNYRFNLTKVDNIYVLSIIGVEGGNYTITILNNESTNYNASNDTAKFVIGKSTSSVNITNVTYGVYNTTCVVVKVSVVNQTNVSFTVTNVTHNFTVNVTFSEGKVIPVLIRNDGEFATVSVSCTDYSYHYSVSNYTFTISGLNSGDYNITVLNNRSCNFENAFDNDSFIVYKANSTVNVTAADGIFNTTNVAVNVTVVNQTDLSKVYLVVINSTGHKFNVILVKIDNGVVVTDISRLPGQFMNVTVNGTAVSKGLNYTYNFIISGLVAGSYNITVFNGETRNYTASDNYDLFNVSKAGSTVNVTADYGVYNTTNVNMNITLVNRTVMSYVISNGIHNFTVNVSSEGVITIDGKDGEFVNVNVTITSTRVKGRDCNYTFVISGLNAGDYNVTVYNAESTNYNPSSANASFVVYRASSNVTVVNAADGVYNTSDVAVNVSVVNQTSVSFVVSNGTHNFTVYVNGNKVSIERNDGEFVNVTVVSKVIAVKGIDCNYTLVISRLDAGNYNITVLNNQSSNYNASMDNASFVVYRASSNVTVINTTNAVYNTTDVYVNVSVVNQTSVSFIVTNGTHNFTVYVNGTKVTIDKKDGEFANVSVVSKVIAVKGIDYNYTFVISRLDAGNYNITVLNNQSSNYNTSMDNASFTVYKANSSVIIGNIVNGTYNLTSVNVTYSIINETTVSYIIKNTVTGDNFTVTLKDNKFEVVNASAGLDVTNYRFNLTKVDDSYVLSIIGVEGGRYTITVLNIESGNYNASNNTSYEFAIFRSFSKVNITGVGDGVYNTTGVAVNVSVVNQTNVSFTVTNGTNNFTVNVTVNDNSVSLVLIRNNGEFATVSVSCTNYIFHDFTNNYTFVINGLNSGEYNITVLNSKSDNYESSFDNASFIVYKADSTVNVTAADGIYNTTNVVVNVTVVNQTDLSEVYFTVVNSTGGRFNVSFEEIINGVVKTRISGLSDVFAGVGVKVIVVNRGLNYTYNIVISGLIADTYNMTVFNGETRNYTASDNYDLFNVSKAGSAVNVVAADGIYNTTNVVVTVNVVNQTDLSEVYFTVINSTSDSFNVTLSQISNDIVLTSISRLSGQFAGVDVKGTAVNNGLDYTYNFIISGLAAGSYNITVFNGETRNYTASNNYDLFNVSKANSTADVTASNGIYNTTDVEVNVTLVNRTVLSYIISNGTHNFTVKVSNDGVIAIVRNTGEFSHVNVTVKPVSIIGLECNYTFILSGLDAGNYNITVYNDETGNYNSAINNDSFVVYRATSNVTIVNVADGVYNTTSVSVNVSVVNQTSVSFVVTNGTHNFTVHVNGNTVEIERNGDEFVNVNVVSGIIGNTGIDYSYLFSIGGLDAGSYNITVLNNQSGNYYASMDNASFTVYKANSSVIIDSIVNGTFNASSVNVTYTIINETTVSYIIKNTVTGDNFTVIIKDNKFEVVNASAGLDVGNYRFDLTETSDYYVLSIIGVEGGRYTITILNAESGNYNASNNTSFEFTIFRSSSKVNITGTTDGVYNTTDAVVDVSVVNQTSIAFTVSNGTHNFTVNVTGNGIIIYRNDGEFTKVNVTFKASDITGLDCNYTFVISGLDAGDYNITVSNTISDNFENSLDNASFKVIKANSTVNVTATDGIFNTNDVVVNFTVVNQTDLSKVYFIIANSTGDEFIVTLKEITNGIVKTDGVESLNIKGNVISNGLTYDYTFIINGLMAGNYNITVFSNETRNYNAFKANNTFIVYKAPSSVNITAADGVFNTTDVYVNMSVVNKTSVSFVIGNGSANITVNVVDGEFNVDYGEFTGVRVIKQNIIIDGLNYTYNFIISGLNAGKYNITGFNHESDNYNASQFNESFTVVKASSSVNIISAGDAVYNTTSVLVNVVVVNQTGVSFVIGNVTANFTVSVVDGNLIVVDKGEFTNVDVIKVRIDADGLDYTYEFIISGLDAGKYNITAFNAESDNYNMSSDDNNFTVFKANSTVVIDNVLNAVYNTTDISFDAHIVNQTSISFVVTNGTSSFTVNVTINNGEFTYTAGSVKVTGKLNSNSSSDYNYTFIISGLNAGSYNITLYNDETRNYNLSEYRANFTVYKANSSITVTGVEDGVYNTSSASVTYHIVNQTDVTYYIINNNTGANFTVVNNNGVFEVVNYTQGLNINQFRFNLTGSDDDYTFTVVGIDGGNYTIVIINHENSNYNSFNMSADFNVERTTSKVIISDIDDAVFNTTNVIISVSVINQTSVSFVVGNASGNFTVNITLDGDTPVITYISRADEFSDAAVTVSLNGHTAVDYNYIIVISYLEQGTYNITVKNDISINYLNSSDSASFNVTRASSSVDITPVNGIYNTTEAIVNFTVVNQTDLSKVYFIIKNEAGDEFNVTFDSITGDIVRLKVNSAQNQFENILVNTTVIRTGLTYNYSVKIAGLDAGRYNITVFNDETRNYNASRANDSFIVFKASSDVNITGISNGIYNTTDVVVNFTVINQTSVSFMIVNSTDNFTVNITLNGNDPNFTVNGAEGFGDINITGSVSRTGSKYDYSVIISKINVNYYHIIVYNAENYNYNASSDEMEFNMGKSNSTVDISAANGIFNTTDVVVNITVVNQTTLSFKISNKTNDIVVDVNIEDNKPVFIIVSGSTNIRFKGNVTVAGLEYNYVFTVNGLNAGDYNITAYNSESVNYTSSMNSTDFIVYKASSKVNTTAIDGVFNTTDVTVEIAVVNETSLSFEIKDKNGISCKVDVTFTGSEVEVILTDNIGGVNISSSRFENGKYTLLISGLNAGEYNITAFNDESFNYNASTDNASFKVLKANSTVNVTEIADGIYDTLDVTVTVDVVNRTDVSYTVKFTNGTVVRDNITLTDLNFVISGLVSGNYTLGVYNWNSSNYNGYETEVNFTVAKATTGVNITDIRNGIYDVENVIVDFKVINQTDISFVVNNGTDEFTVTLNIAGGNIIPNVGDAFDNVNVECRVIGDYYEIEISGLNYGSYEITIKNNESDNYNASSDVGKFNVSKASSTVNVESTDGIYDTDDVTVNFSIVNQTDLSKVYFVITNSNGDEINITLTTIISGEVTTEIKGSHTVTATGHAVSSALNYDYSFVISNLPADNYTVSVFNGETLNYNASSANDSFKVHKASTNIKVDVTNGVYDTVNVVVGLTVVNETSVSFDIINENGLYCRVNVTRTMDGVITVTEGTGRVYSSEYQNGRYTLVIEGLAAGNYNIAAYNVESDNYNASSDSNSFSVTKSGSSIEIISVSDGIYDTKDVSVLLNVLNKTEITYTVKYLNGTVVFENVSVSDIKFAISSLNAGNYSITVYNLENENYTASNASGTFNVGRASSDTQIIDATGSIYNTVPARITIAIVNETRIEYIIRNADGETVDGYTIVRENSTVSISGLKPDNYTIEVINMQNNNYNSSSASQGFTIAKASSEVVISPIVNVTFNENNIIVNYTIYNRTSYDVYVVSRTTGKVIAPLSISEDRIIFDLIAAGNYTIRIVNDESELYNSSYAVSDFEVYKAGSSVKITPIGNKEYRDEIVITYGVSNRTGDVELYKYKDGIKDFTMITPNPEAINVIPNSNYTYTNMTFSSLSPGSYMVTVINPGNENFTESSDTMYFNIIKAASEVNLTVTDNGVFTINITDGANGIVTLKFNDSSIQDIELTNSSKVTSISLPSGNYTVTPYYNGNDNYQNSTGSPVSFTIDNTKQIDMNVSIINPTYPDNGTVIVTSDVDGQYIVEIDGKKYNVTVKNGRGNVTVDQLPLGIYDVNVSSNIVNYDVNQRSSRMIVYNSKINGDAFTIDSKDLTRGYNSPYDFKATFYDIYGDVLKNTEVEFIIDGVSYKVMTDNVGVASVKLRLDVGQYKVYSRNIRTDEMTLNNLTIVKRLMENKNLETDYNSGYNYRILVIDDDGTPVGEGVEFVIPINGKFYSYVTDSKGYINIKIDQRFVPSVSKNKLTYTFTLSYKGYSIKNTVTIKQILKTAKKVTVKKSAKKLVLKARLKLSNGKALKNKKITFKFKGKTYKAKTNKKGIAKVTIKKKVIRKLKKGKNYTVKITYLKDTIKSFVKVKK